LDVDQLAKEISDIGKPSFCVSKLDELRSKIDEFTDKNSVLLVLSNRTCLGLWESSFVQELRP